MMQKTAMFSDDRIYRYSLSRIWNERKGVVAFIGLNPSTADENVDDPTITRCIRFTDSWGYGGITMVNLFAFRATNPKDMKAAKDPVGPSNDLELMRADFCSDLVILAWGIHGDFLNRNKKVLSYLREPHCLALTKAGQPRHPLYLSKDLKPIRFEL